MYTDGFAEVLPAATALVRDVKVSTKIDRVLGIWLERSVYVEPFIKELRQILHGPGVYLQQATSKIVAEFKPDEMAKQMQLLRTEIASSERQLKSIPTSCCVKVDQLTLAGTLSQLKDKAHGEQFSCEFDEWQKILSKAIESLENQVQARTSLLSLLEKSEIFYETQQNETKIVINAYASFANRVKTVREHLRRTLSSENDETISPLMMIDAPSPTGSDDGPVLPSSGNSPLPGMRSLMSVFAEQSKINKPSSLDQRLSSLMQNMPATSTVATVEARTQISLSISKTSETVSDRRNSNATAPLSSQSLTSFSKSTSNPANNHDPNALKNQPTHPDTYGNPMASIQVPSKSTASYAHFESMHQNSSYAQNQRYAYSDHRAVTPTQMYPSTASTPSVAAPLQLPLPSSGTSSLSNNVPPHHNYYGISSSSYDENERHVTMNKRRDRIDHHLSANLVDIRSNQSGRSQPQVQHIRPLVSTRDGHLHLSVDSSDRHDSIVSTKITMPNISKSFDSYPFDGENFEPADMELGNSDEEDQLNRSCNSQRVLKVIETCDGQSELEHSSNGSAAHVLHQSSAVPATPVSSGSSALGHIPNYYVHSSHHHHPHHQTPPPQHLHPNHQPPQQFYQSFRPKTNYGNSTAVRSLDLPVGASRWRNDSLPASNTTSYPINHGNRLSKFRNNSSNRNYYY